MPFAGGEGGMRAREGRWVLGISGDVGDGWKAQAAQPDEARISEEYHREEETRDRSAQTARTLAPHPDEGEEGKADRQDRQE